MPDVFDYQVIVIGSGFGGAVVAYNLAQKMDQVLILERGRRWTPDMYPSVRDENGESKNQHLYMWHNRYPEKYNGWFDVRLFPHVAVIQGAGVGGGSLHYANVSIVPDESLFTEENGFPESIKFEVMKPHYDEVGEILEVKTLPRKQWSPRSKLVEQAAKSLPGNKKPSYHDQGQSYDFTLAVRFNHDPNFGYLGPTLTDEEKLAQSLPDENKWGVPMGTCVHLGDCDIGCRANARNTLDLNYIHLAEENGAEVWPLSKVNYIEPFGKGYRIHYRKIIPGKEPETGTSRPKQVTSKIIVLAAGSLGSTEILLRSQKKGALPDLSPMLGQRWHTNGDYLTTSTSVKRAVEVYPGEGITIDQGIRFFGPFKHEEVEFLMENGATGGILSLLSPGFFELILRVIMAGLQIGPRDFQEKRAKRHFSVKRRVSRQERYKKHAEFLESAPSGFRRFLRRLLPPRADKSIHKMFWFANGRDAGEGQMKLREFRWKFLRKKTPHEDDIFVGWKPKKSLRLYKTVHALQNRMAKITGFRPDTSWPMILRYFPTPHPLGGCRMGTGPDDGVVDEFGRVFRVNATDGQKYYQNLYVADGSILPSAVGSNPSRTIAAFANRIAKKMIKTYLGD